MKLGVFTAAVLAFSITQCIAGAEVPFKKAANGDLRVRVSKLNRAHVNQLRLDIPGNQGKCVAIQIAEIMDYETDYDMVIPAERHGIEFIKREDRRLRVVCGRFTEDQYDYNGNLVSSLEYEQIEGY